jgi:uncharacterized membrane protein HdeD (DUF308 family)
MSPSQSSANSNASAALTKSMHDHWGLYLGEGIVLVLLGFAAILFPFIAGIVATVFLGWLFLIAGIVGLVSTFRGRQAPGFGWSLLSAMVALMAGTVLLWNPLQSLVTLPSGLVILTYVLIAYFIVDGILMIILAIAHRRELSGKWEWILINGVIDLILAGIIISGLPGRSSGRSACSSGSTWCSAVPRSSPSRWRRARRRLSRDKDLAAHPAKPATVR